MQQQQIMLAKSVHHFYVHLMPIPPSSDVWSKRDTVVWPKCGLDIDVTFELYVWRNWNVARGVFCDAEARLAEHQLQRAIWPKLIFIIIIINPSKADCARVYRLTDWRKFASQRKRCSFKLFSGRRSDWATNISLINDCSEKFYRSI